MPKDDLASGRRLRDDLRQLKERYPKLTTPAPRARLTAHMRTQTDDVGIPTERKERPMPAKGQRGFGEDLVLLNVRIPKSDMAFIDQHVRTLQRLHRYTRQGRSEAARDLIQKGIDSIENPPQLARPTAPPVEPAATTAGGAIPPAPAYEARALAPDLEPEPPLTMEPTNGTQDSAVLPTAPKRLGRKPVLREPILALLRENPDGLTAAQLKVYLDTEKPIGDTLAGMVKAALLVKDGSGKAVRYLLANAVLAPSRH